MGAVVFCHAGEPPSSVPASYGSMDFPPARRDELQKAFDAVKDEGGRLALREAHKLLFTADERGEYGFDNFDEDLQATNGGCKDDMSWEDVVKFLDDNL